MALVGYEKFFIIKGEFYNKNCLPSLNNLISEAEKNPYAYNRLKRQMEQIAINSIRVYLKGWKTQNQVQLHFEFGEKNKGQKRDFDNIASAGWKIIGDALVKTGTIKDDAPKYLLPSTNSFVYTENPYVKVYIKEIL